MILNIQTSKIADFHLPFKAIPAMIAKIAVVKSKIPTVFKNSTGKPPYNCYSAINVNPKYRNILRKTNGSSASKIDNLDTFGCIHHLNPKMIAMVPAIACKLIMIKLFMLLPFWDRFFVKLIESWCINDGWQKLYDFYLV